MLRIADINISCHTTDLSSNKLLFSDTLALISSSVKSFIKQERIRHLSPKKTSYRKKYWYIFLTQSFFSFSTTHVNVNIYNRLFLVLKLYLLVAITSGFRMDNIPVINRLKSGMQKKV